MTDVLWHCGALRSSEFAVVDESADGWRVRGTAALERGGRPCLVTYEVVADADWTTTAASAVVESGTSTMRIELTAHAGRWQRAGLAMPELQGCTDVDLGWTPSTNTLPIRRLASTAGEQGTRVALLRFPELELVAAEQTYERLAADRWRFAMDDFSAELVVDPVTGLVREYGDDLWRGLSA